MGESSAESGQGMVEYIVIGILVALGVLFAVLRYGGSLYDKYECSTATVQTMTVGDKAAKLAACGKVPDVAAPLAQDPMGPQARHHIGDGSFGSGAGGGSLVNEGPTFSVPFTITQEMIDFANANSNGVLHLSFTATGVNYPQNTVSIDGNVLGTLNNPGDAAAWSFPPDAENSFQIDANQLGPGEHTLLFQAQDIGTPGNPNLDDIEVDQIQIDYQQGYQAPDPPPGP